MLFAIVHRQSTRRVLDQGHGPWPTIFNCRVADEVARIEREFEGEVSLTVTRDLIFTVVSDTLNVRFNQFNPWGVDVILA